MRRAIVPSTHRLSVTQHANPLAEATQAIRGLQGREDRKVTQGQDWSQRQAPPSFLPNIAPYKRLTRL